MVGFSILPDPDAYLARTGAFFGADPVLHTLPLGVADAVRLGRYPTWVLSLVESSSGDVVAVGVQTPPYNQIVAAVDREALHTLAVGLAGSDVVLPGVTAQDNWYVYYPYCDYGYWYPYYWYPYCWYYPWTSTAVNYPVGTLVMYMVAQKDADPTAQRVPVAWVGVVRGILSSASDTNADRAAAGVDQAFEQSKYLGEGK